MKLIFLVGVILLSTTFSTAYITHWGQGLSRSPSSSIHLSNLKLRLNPLKIIKSDDGDDNEGMEMDFMTGLTRRKDRKSWRKPDNRDSLPFIITAKTDDGKSFDIGTFLMDPTTSCGDTIDLSGNIYTVSAVSFLYTYESGGYRVFKKKLKVVPSKTSFSDFAIEDKSLYLQ